MLLAADGWVYAKVRGTRRVAKDGSPLAQAVADGGRWGVVPDAAGRRAATRAPAAYTPEQGLRDRCDDLREAGGERSAISHWSQREIADEAMRRGLVSNISQRSVGRFLKKRLTSNRIASGTG